MSYRYLLPMLPILLTAWWWSGCKAHREPLPVVASVDLQRYAGRWYEIARYPNCFERNCVGVTANYILRDDGKIRVENRAHVGSLDGKMKTAIGRAWVAPGGENAKLHVSFFAPFQADYWIIALGEQYDYAVVSEPSRHYLWILCRTPKMDEVRYQQLLTFLTTRGFDTTKLVVTPQ